jgi:hypothetical protein
MRVFISALLCLAPQPQELLAAQNCTGAVRIKTRTNRADGNVLMRNKMGHGEAKEDPQHR